MSIFSKAILLLFFTISGQFLFGQFTVNTAVTATAMAEALAGDGVEVANATLVVPNTLSKGIFTNSGTPLQISQGIVLTSGRANQINSNRTVNASNTYGVGSNDADLHSLTDNNNIRDASILEFDFRPVGDSIRFNFVFASEEYPEYACSSFNDVFGFFISGPGFAGTTNIALVPGTDIPVAINSINPGEGAFGDIEECEAMGSGSPFTQYYVPNNGSAQNFVYDGLTVVLVAEATVESCQWYHLKIAIADVGDSAFDSGVFIEGGSLETEVVTLSLDSDPAFPVCPTDLVTYTATIEGTDDDDIVYTWIKNGVIVYTGGSVFVDNEAADDDRIEVLVNYSANCEGLKVSQLIEVDFLPNVELTEPASICFGESYWFDGVEYTEANNTATMEIEGINGDCDTIVTLNLTIEPLAPLTFSPVGPFCQYATAPDLPDNPTNEPTVTGTWSPSTINTSTPGTFTYTFTPDEGQCFSPYNLTVTINPEITPTFNQIPPICQNTTPPGLPGSSTNSPPITGTWSPSTINTSTVGTTTYTFTPTSGVCVLPTTMDIEIFAPDEVTLNPIGPLCQNSTPPGLPGTSADNPAVQGTWSPATINTSTPGITEYTFTPNAGQCGLPSSIEIEILPEIELSFDQLGPYCQGDTPDDLPSTSTNTPAITGTWSPATISTSSPGTFTYTFTPEAGTCADPFEMEITIDPPETPEFDQLGPYCQGDTPDDLPTISTNNPSITGTWSPATISTSSSGVFTYTFTPDAAFCAEIVTMDITIDAPVVPQFDPVDPLCLNSDDYVLPPNSTNNPSITGTWDPPVISTGISGVFTSTFTPTSGQCATTTTLDITIEDPIDPTFDQIGPLCQHSGGTSLSGTSVNNISGTWNPSVINTATPGISTYIFTPDADECASTFSMDIEILPEIEITFDLLGPYCVGSSPDILPPNSTNNPSIPGTWSPSTISTSSPGTFTYVFTAVAGTCAEPYEMEITIDPPVLPLFNQLGPYCQDATPDNLPTSSNDNPTITGSWNPSTINTSTPGTFTYTFTPDASFCADEVTMNITINAPIEPKFNPIDPLCLNDEAYILPNVSIDIPPINGTWNPPAIETDIAGVYTSVFTPDAGQCATTSTISVIVEDPIDPLFSPIGPLCQFSTGVTLPQTSGNGISGSWQPAIINTSVPGVSSYTFTPNGDICANIFVMQIEILPEIALVFDPLGPYCLNDVPDILPTSPSNEPTVTGNWNPSTISTSVAGVFNYTFTPDDGICADPVVIEIVIENPNTPNFTLDLNVCQNMPGPVLPSISFDNPPYTGSWSPATVATDQLGTFDYTFTPDPGQCAAPVTFSITIYEPPAATINPLGPYCQGTTPPALPGISADNPPVSGQWTPAIINTALSGSFDYTFTPDPGQCAGPVTIEITITEPTQTTFDDMGPFCFISTPPVLPNSSTNSPPIFGTWTPPVINTSLIGFNTYTFTPNANFCATPAELVIQILPLPVVIIDPVAPLCLDDPAIQLAAQPEGGFWVGSHVIGNQFTPDAVGNFTILYFYTDENGCTSQESIQIQVNDCSCTNPAAADAGIDDAICIGGSYQLSGSISIATEATWSTSGTGSFADINDLNTTYTPSQQDINNGSVTITLTTNDPDGSGPCSPVSDQMILTIQETPVEFEPVNPVCFNSPAIMLTASPGGGIFNGNGVTGNTFNPMLAGEGTHTITYTLQGNCTGSDQIEITVYPGTDLNINPVDQLCLDDPAVTLTATPSGGAFSGTNVVGNTFQPVTTGTFEITYTYTDSYGCTYTETINIQVNNCNCIEAPTANAGVDQEICEGNAVSLTGQVTGSTALWTTSGSGNFTNPNDQNTTYLPSASDVTAGSVTLTLTAIDPDGPDGPCPEVSDGMLVTFITTDININPVSPLCISASVVTLSATPIGGFFTGPGVSGLTFNPAIAGAGTHTISYHYDGQCPETESIVIIVNPLPGLNIVHPGDLCSGDDPVTLIASPTGGFFSGDNVDAGGVFNPAVPGSFTIIYQYTDGNGCANTTSIIIEVNDCGCDNPVTALAGNDTSICANEIIQLSGWVSSNTSGQWSTSGDGSFEDDTDLNTIYTPGNNDLLSGIFEIILTALDPDGTDGPCSPFTDKIEITILTTNIQITSVPEMCINATPVTLMAIPTGGEFSGPGITNGVFDPSLAGPGTHTLTYTINSPCPALATIDIIVNPLPDVMITPVEVLCAGDSPVTLTASPAGGIFTGTNVTGNTFAPEVPGSYSIHYNYTGSDGCGGSATIEIIVEDCGCDNPVTADAGNDIEICIGEKINLNGTITGNTTGEWTTTGDGVFSNVNDLNATYTPGPFDLSSGTVTLSLTAADPDGSNGPCHPFIDQLSVNIIIIPEIVFNLPVSICTDEGPIFLHVQPFGGEWIGEGIAGNEFDPSLTDPGVYTFYYLYSEGQCTVIDSTNITVLNCDCPNPISIQSLSDQVICKGELVSLNASVSPVGTIVNWSTNGDGIFTDPDALTTQYIPGVQDILTGQVVLNLTAPDPDGAGPCEGSSDQLSVNIISIEEIIITTPDELCHDDAPVVLNATPAGGVWSGAGLSGNSFDPSSNGPGTYEFIYTVTSGICKVSDTLNLEVIDCDCPLTIELEAGPDVSLCAGEEVPLNAEVAGVSGVTWSTSGSGIFTDNRNPATIYIPSDSDIESGFVILTITTDDPDGIGPCQPETDQLSILIKTIETINILVSQPDCVTSTGTLTVLPPTVINYLYSIDNGVEFDNNSIIVGLEQGDYTLIVKDIESECTATTDFSILPPPVVDADWKVTSSLCSGSLTNFVEILSAQNMQMPITVNLNGIDHVVHSLPWKADNLPLGQYEMVLTDAKECQIEGSFNLTAGSDINIDIDYLYVVDAGESVLLSPIITGDVSEILWTPGTWLSCVDCLNPTATPEEEIIYNLLVTDSQGCTDEANVRIIVRKNINIFAPNAITPNNDGVNDKFTIFTDDNIDNIGVLRIYSRWGELVFEKFNFLPNMEDEGWDGTFEGQPMNPAVFVWYAEVDIPGEGQRLIKGGFTLIR